MDTALIMSLQTKAKRDSLLASGIIVMIGKLYPVKIVESIPAGRVCFVKNGKELYIGISWGDDGMKSDANTFIFNVNTDRLEIVNYDVDDLGSISINSGVIATDVKRAVKRYKEYLKVAEKNWIPLSKDSKNELMQDTVIGILNARHLGNAVRADNWRKRKARVARMYYRYIHRTKKEIGEQFIRWILSLVIRGGAWYIAYVVFWPFDLQNVWTKVSIYCVLILSWRFTGERRAKAETLDERIDKTQPNDTTNNNQT